MKMLNNSPTAELEMKSPKLQWFRQLWPVILPLSWLDCFSTRFRISFPTGCCTSGRTVFTVSRGMARPKQGARIATADRLVFIKCSLQDLHIGFLRRHRAWRGPLATEDTPVHLSAQIVIGSGLFSLNLFVRNVASKHPPRCAASRARTCIHCNGPYESAWDRRVLVLVSCVILRCGYRPSL